MQSNVLVVVDSRFEGTLPFLLFTRKCLRPEWLVRNLERARLLDRSIPRTAVAALSELFTSREDLFV